MTKTELLYLLKNKTISGIIETADSTEKEVVIKGLTTDGGYELSFAAAAGADGYHIVARRPLYEAERASFLKKLADAKPDSVSFIRSSEMSLEEIRNEVQRHAEEIHAGGWGANIHYDGSIRIRFDEEVKRSY